MKRVLSIMLISVSFIFAGFIPNKVYTTITAVNGSSITLQNPFPYNGMSGLVVRDLPTGEFALLTIKQTSPGVATIIDKDPLGGKNLANLKPIPKVGDRVIGGFLYDKVMVLAPNKDTYINVQNKYGLKSQNPDLFMSFLANKGKNTPDSSDYKEFAKLTHIGIFVIFKNGFVTVYDPISQTDIGRVMMDVSSYNAQKPFYNTFK